MRKTLASLAVLRCTGFRRFFVAQTTSLLGDGMTAVALAFAVLDLTGSASDLGLVLAARAVPLVVMLVLGGVVADRLSRRRIMIVADLVRMSGQGTLAGLLLAHQAQIWQLVALQAVQGFASAAFDPASSGLIPHLVPTRFLQQANALRGLSLSIGNIVGPALAGLLVALDGPGTAIAVDAATFGLSALALARVPALPRVAVAVRSLTGDLADGWAEFRSRTWLWVTVVSSSFANLLLSALLVLGPLVARRSLGGPAGWATVLTSLGTGFFVGGLLVLRIRPTRALRTGMAALIACALPTLGLAARLPLAAEAVVAALAGVGLTVFNALWTTTMQRHVPRAVLSRVSAYDQIGSLAGQPLGQAVVGPIAVGAGVLPTLWFCGAAQVCVAALALTVPRGPHAAQRAGRQRRAERHHGGGRRRSGEPAGGGRLSRLVGVGPTAQSVPQPHRTG